MRYIDTGSRDPNYALGTWLGRELIGVGSLKALRVQTGFFGAAVLGYFEDAFADLSQSDGHTRFLIGSNDGQTTHSAVAALLSAAGQPRPGLAMGVVSFQTGYFHPKVVHIQRSDGSSTAYVGSANVTRSGATSLHVEAGLVLDSRTGDPVDVLDEIAGTIDAWFVGGRPGFYEVVDDDDIDDLVSANILDVVQPSPPARVVLPAVTQGAVAQPAHSLKPLVAAPPLHQSATSTQPAKSAQTPGPGSQTPPTVQAAPAPPPIQAAVKHWGKKLSASDAQRKKTGNQRGAITLVQGDYRGLIDQTTYFRNDLFGKEKWTPGFARTGQPVERAAVPMHVTIDNVYHGVLNFEITNGTTREASQNNYTAELHIEPIAQINRQSSIEGKHMDITLDANGDYWLTIT